MARVISVLLAALLATLPTAGISLCVKGIAADVCCEEENAATQDSHGAETSLQGTTCDCCFTVDALPFDRGASGSRDLFGLIAMAVASRGLEAPPAPRSTVNGQQFTVDSSRHALQSVVLLI